MVWPLIIKNQRNTIETSRTSKSTLKGYKIKDQYAETSNVSLNKWQSTRKYATLKNIHYSQ